MLLILLFAVCSSAFGESITPPHRSGEITVKASLKKDPVQFIRLGSFVATFEKTTLDEIKDALSLGAIQHAGDAGESQYWLCYSLPGQRIWLISHGEMGGSDHALTQVQAITTSPTFSTHQEKAACPSIPWQYQSISTSFGWIGKSKKALLNILGQPSGIKGNRLIFFYRGTEIGPYYDKQVEWDVLGFVEAEIIDDKISSLYASHVTSY